jgi:recombination protein RecA
MCASPVFSSAAMDRPFIFLPHSSLSLDVLTEKEATKKPAQKAASTAAFASATATKMKSAEILAHVGAVSKLAAVVPASRLEVRATPEMVSSGIPQLDALAGGFPRGCLTEICGTASSGRTSILLSALAHATQRGEVCALVDASDAFDPASAAAAGMEMSRLLWVRCGEKSSSRRNPPSHKNPSAVLMAGRMKTSASYRGISASYQGMPSGIPPVAENGFGFSRWESQLGQMLKVTDLLLQSNGFGMIVLDLGDVPVRSARQIPLASWFRFRRAVEHTPTVLLVLEQQPIAGSCSSVLVKVSGKKLSALSSQLSGNRSANLRLTHSELLDQLDVTAELLRSRFERKPVQPAVSFTSRAVWAG